MTDLRAIERYLHGGMSDCLEKQLKKAVPLLRQNQTAPLPPYPYVVYNLTAALKEAGGTACEDEGGVFKAAGQSYSLTAVARSQDEALRLAQALHGWLAFLGNVYLAAGGLVVTKLGPVLNRDNFISTEYEMRQGFDFDIGFVNHLAGSRAGLNGEVEGVIWP